jgi:beta-galactosidase
MRLWAWRAVAHGACGISFFRWRCCRWGQEQHGDGILGHSGRENRRYRELARMGAEIARAGELIDRTAPDNAAALVMSYESRWALEAGLGLEEFDGALEAVRIHERLLERNIGIDATDPRDPLDRYRVVFAPRLFLVDGAIAANLGRYVESGGLLVLTAASGVVDEHNRSFDTPRPGPLAAMAGIEVSDLSPLHSPVPLESAAVPGLQGQQATTLADEIHPTTAEVLARFAGGWRSGLPAVTLNRCGKGRVLYVATALEGVGQSALVDHACGLAGLRPILETPPGVRAHLRLGPGIRLLFLLNNGDEERHVAVGPGWRDALGGEPVHTARVAPVDMRLLRGQEEGR